MPHVIDFRNAETFAETARLLGLPQALLKLAISGGRNPDQSTSLYTRHRIPKKGGVAGQFRTVWEVDPPQIRDAHRAFAWRFDAFARDVLKDFPHPSAFGYVRKRGIRDNAEKHVGSRKLLCCDLKDFFATITTSRLASRFLQIGISSTAAETLASFLTIEGSLALGLNASPMLANLVCLDLDHKLSRLSAVHGCVYTRYADDIAISGENPPQLAPISDIVEGEGFKISPRKVRLTKLGQSHFVTGLSVSGPGGPHVPRLFKKRLRQELYYCQKFGLQEHLAKIDADSSCQKGINRLDGSVRFLSSIEPERGKQMRSLWGEILARDSARVSYAPVHDRPGVEATILVDEAEFEYEGKKYLALACVTTERITKIREITDGCLHEYLIDPFSPGRKGKLKQRGLHFSDAPEGLRSAYILLLPFLSFRGYVAFREIPTNNAYWLTYAALLSDLLPCRLMSYDRGQLTITIEENSRVPESELKRLVSGIYRDLESKNERRPITPPPCEVKGKREETALSLPDCLLSVFTRAFSGRGQGASDYLQFERLRDKYRHILNAGTGDMYSRRHPIEMRRPSATE